VPPPDRNTAPAAPRFDAPPHSTTHQNFAVSAEPAKTAHFCSMCGPHFCAMRITQDVREYARKQGLPVYDALATGMEEKAREFRAAGGTIYQKP